MHKKIESPLDGVVRHNTLRILFILFTLFSFHSSLFAENISLKEDNATARADKYNSMGVTYYKKGKYDKALESFEKSLKIKLATIGENNPDTATSYNNIGMAWNSKGEYDKAIEFYNKSLKINLATIGENNPDTATSYNNICMAWNSKGEYDKAIEFYNKALKIFINRLGENHYKTRVVRNNLAYAFNGLASSYRDKKEYQKAIDYYNRALLLHKKIAQINSSYSDDVLTDIENIIKTHQENNNPQKAKEIYTKALNYYNGLFKKDKKVYGLVSSLTTLFQFIKSKSLKSIRRNLK